MNLGTGIHVVATLAFLALFGLLATGRRTDPLGHRLTLAAAVSALWFAVITVGLFQHRLRFVPLYVSEMARDWAWIWVLIRPLETSLGKPAARRLRAGVLAMLPVVLLAAIVVSIGWLNPLVVLGRSSLLASFAVLVLIEQVYRNASIAARGWLRYLLLAVGAQFAFELFMAAQAELLGTIGDSEVLVRALVATGAVPLVLLAARRSSNSSTGVFVSRHIVFYTTGLTAVGIYLCAMALGGYYVRMAGGTWGDLLQLVFLAGAVLVLVSLILSSTLRRRLLVFISKHFYSNKYDYRVEWQRFVRLLSVSGPETVHESALRAMAQVFASPGGALYVLDGPEGPARLAAVWDEGERDRFYPSMIDEAREMLAYQVRRAWIFDMKEYRAAPAAYDNVSLPPWLLRPDSPRIVSPLFMGEQLTGLVMLHQPPPFDLTFEDRDLLLTMGRHVATQISHHEANRQLSENQQFVAYSRLTAFMMHDLKNSVAQLKLVSANAARHRNDPRFIEDAMSTIDNAVARIGRLIEQLKGDTAKGANVSVDLCAVLETVAQRCADRQPRPVIEPAARLMVDADSERVTNALEHLVRNAQDASSPEGGVLITAGRMRDEVQVCISDNGTGMTEEFIRDRLFKPFDSTKGAAGMGIGAYQAREYFRLLGGSIEVRSEPGRGTQVQVRLPASRSEQGNGG